MVVEGRGWRGGDAAEGRGGGGGVVECARVVVARVVGETRHGAVCEGEDEDGGRYREGGRGDVDS